MVARIVKRSPMNQSHLDTIIENVEDRYQSGQKEQAFLYGIYQLMLYVARKVEALDRPKTKKPARRKKA